jgi:hypothetical protein
MELLRRERRDGIKEEKGMGLRRERRVRRERRDGKEEMGLRRDEERRDGIKER